MALNEHEHNPMGGEGSGRPAGVSARERMADLLADRATVGLTAAEQAELQLLAHELGERADESLERTAARLTVALLGRPATYSAMPTELFQKIQAAGDEWARASAEPLGLRGPELPSLMEGLEPERPVVAGRIGFWSRARKTWPTWGGWVAAAASLTIAAVASRPGPTPAPVVVYRDREVPVQAAVAGEPAPTVILNEPVLVRHELEPAAPVLAVAKHSPVEGLDRLVASASEDVLKVPAQVTEALGEAGGRVEAEFVWSQGDSRGFLTVAGLPPTDPTRQYQVWVRDGERAEPHPINGGTFDIASEGPRWVIPIEPKLPVFRASAFEVTSERAGGVVVSSPERVILSAAVVRVEDLVGPPSSLATRPHGEDVETRE